METVQVDSIWQCVSCVGAVVMIIFSKWLSEQDDVQGEAMGVRTTKLFVFFFISRPLATNDLLQISHSLLFCMNCCIMATLIFKAEHWKQCLSFTKKWCWPVDILKNECVKQLDLFWHWMKFSRLQHPNLPTIGYAQSILMRDSRGCDSFTKDTLLSASDWLLLAQLFTSGEEGL